jgi:DNA primase small subunit
VRRWRDLEAEVSRAARPSAADARDHAARDRKAALSTCLDRAVLACAYPRLDVDVSKKRNHLLKAPFCVHPKTGKVCVPFAPGDADGFDVDAVPTAASLLDARGAAAAAGESVAGGWEGPLAPALAVFREGLLAPLAADARAGFAAKAAADARAGEGGRRAEGLAW